MTTPRCNPASASPWSAGLLLAVLIVQTGCGSANAEVDAPLTPEEQAAAEANANELVGISMGNFRIRDHHPMEGARSSLAFHVFARARRADQAKFETMLQQRRHKIRNLVITAARVSDVNDFDDADLQKFRRRILFRIRRSLPELPIQEVLVTEFKFSLEE